ncbi:MotE family protein [Phenylobacterium sp.]|jgi:flagellar motility protein MotE (MotC chaperone)|uniref:MotE family protein n=1 Tax=Phenylobacterium sp. TaxID=1871053 RepID=UPI002F930A3D
MKNIPRILPLVGVAMGGVLAINAMAGARGLPNLVSGAKAFAEEAAKGAKPEKGKDEKAETGEAKDVAAGLPPPTITPKAVCAPTAAELAKEAGLSPAELQVLQSLGVRRGQLDERENELNTQLALMAAAEAKLDAKVKALTGLKGDIQALLVQAEKMEAAEIDRLVRVFEGMKAKDAAPRFVMLDDSVRLPIAAKMKERALSAIMAQMPPSEAKKLSEGMAKRFTEAKAMAANAAAEANKAAAQAGAQPAAQAGATPPAKAATPAPKRQPPRQARNTPQPKAATPQPQAQAAAPPAAAPAVPPSATPAPKAG